MSSDRRPDGKFPMLMTFGRYGKDVPRPGETGPTKGGGRDTDLLLPVLPAS